MSSTCPHNMVNFGPPAAEIGPVVWGTPANFNGFRVLAALLHGTAETRERQPNFAALNRGRHLYSSGWPSRSALAHISSFIFYLFFFAESQPSQIGCLPYLRCRSEICCTRLAENSPKSRQKIAIWAPSHNFVGLYLRN